MCLLGNRCGFIASFYTVRDTKPVCSSHALCAGEGTTLKANAADITVSVDNQIVAASLMEAMCCEASCATWIATNECPDGHAPLGGVSLESIPVGDDPLRNCCSRPCTMGTRANVDGVCIPCPAGTFHNGLTNSCDICGVGSFAPRGSTSCVGCRPGE